MITYLAGKLAAALPTQAIVDVNGVGYEVLIPLSSYDRLPAVGQPVHILTHLHVREDAQILYGFMSALERDLFRSAGQSRERDRAEARARGPERDERGEF